MEQVKTSEKTEAKKAKDSTKRQVTPKLKCIVTGEERFTNQEYLRIKGEKWGSVGRFVNRYISAPAMKLLRTGKTVAEVRATLKKGADLPIPTETILKEALNMNGKRSSAAKKDAKKTDGAKKQPEKKRSAKKKSATPAVPGPGDEPEGGTVETEAHTATTADMLPGHED